MEQSQLERFKYWFSEYSGRFLGDDEYVNANLKLKQDHTARTCDEIRWLAEALALDANERRIAELIALLHDVGRFPQFAQYRTYNDLRSIDHGRRGVEVLREEGLLEALRPDERQWVETAVGLHNRRSLPSMLKGRALLFTRLVRDADKIDIFRVVLDFYDRRCRPAETETDFRSLEVELPDDPQYQPEVLEAVRNRETVDWASLRTLTDAKLCQLGWVYDLNFTPSLRRIQECGFLTRLIRLLPTDAAIQDLCKKILDDVAARLA